jgi:hypothetical protein
MEATTSTFEYNAVHVLENYDWASLGNATVVDIGGAQGHISLELVKRFENIRAVIQDIENVVHGAEEKVPEELKSRVSFEAHDFFKPQKTYGDVYFLRYVMQFVLLFHNKYQFANLTAVIGPTNMQSLSCEHLFRR